MATLAHLPAAAVPAARTHSVDRSMRRIAYERRIRSWLTRESRMLVIRPNGWDTFDSHGIGRVEAQARAVNALYQSIRNIVQRESLPATIDRYDDRIVLTRTNDIPDRRVLAHMDRRIEKMCPSCRAHEGRHAAKDGNYYCLDCLPS